MRFIGTADDATFIPYNEIALIQVRYYGLQNDGTETWEVWATVHRGGYSFLLEKFNTETIAKEYAYKTVTSITRLSEGTL